MALVGQASELSERAQLLLKALVEAYIAEGQPVGSRTLAKHSGLDLSAATIRNVMADLEEMGYIRSPHTSAGRVPTSKGYRLFVDTLLQIQPVAAQDIYRMQGHLSAGQNADALIHSASSLLSGITALTGVVTVPKRNPASIRQIEFLRLSGTQVLVILVFNRNEVQNRIIDLAIEVSSAELQQAANFLNECLIGQNIQDARQVLLDEMRQHREDMDRIMCSAIELGEMAFANVNTPEEDDYVIAGETNLMTYDDLSDIKKLRELFGAFTRKRDILTLLDKTMRAEGVKIFIGREAGHHVFDDCSLVTAPYSLDDEHVGVLGVIGPKRIPYEKVIPVVDMTAKLLSVALQRQS
ncbi:MAG: heat-inducible transcription repressor HrcA [Proteobacteria bacterium]|nr:MAG: heat-inducible transcription repressor HrcA [Pseudomonadota bacterium]